MFFSKRTFNFLSSCSRCSRDNSFLPVFNGRCIVSRFPLFTTLESSEAASWVFQYRTAWRTPRLAAASRETSSPGGRPCARSEFRSEGDPVHRSKCATRQHICFDVLDHLLSGTPIGRMAGPQAMKFPGWQRLNAEYAKQFGIETPNWPPPTTQES